MTTPWGILPSGPVAEPGLAHATDYKERAVGLLLSQMRDKPRFVKLIEILSRPFQELEDVFWDLYTLRRLNSATGEQLNVLGRILLEPRGGLSDYDYRAVLRIKAKVLFSRGTGPNLIQITQLFLRNNLFTYDEHYPAAVEIAITDPAMAGRVPLLAKFLGKAKSGGVRMDVVDATGPHFHYGTEGTGIGYGVGPYGAIVP